jgi:RNA polymerase sigma factor (TIGR02999 family)
MTRPEDKGDLSETTALFAAAEQGDREAIAGLVQHYYDDLRQLARGKVRVDESMEPTGLVHELFMHLMNAGALRLSEERQFFALALCVMTNILADRRRRKLAAKRNLGAVADELTDTKDHHSLSDLLPLSQALRRLAVFDSDAASVVELRALHGLGFDEIAAAQQCSKRKVYEDWKRARLWLSATLGVVAIAEGVSPAVLRKPCRAS